MADFETLVRIKAESRERVRTFAFGDPVTNVCAGEGNPMRHAFFVKIKGDNVQVTDKRGKFCNFGCQVIYAGHLPVEESDRLFKPFWQAQYS